MSDVNVSGSSDSIRSPSGGSSRIPNAPVSHWRKVLGEALAGGKLSLVLPLIVAIGLLLFGLGDDVYWMREVALVLDFALVVGGLNLSFGFAGEVQFGQVFVFAVGAYVTMYLAVHGFNQIVPLLLIGGLAAALISSLIALPALRIGGWSLAMVSFFLVLVIPDLVSILGKYTGGYVGLVGIPAPDFFGMTLTSRGLYEVTVVCTIILFAGFRNLVTSRFGIIFKSLRESPELVESLGFSTMRVKSLAYFLGAFPAGVAGCLYGYISLIVIPDSFDFTLAIGILAASILGGSEGVYGAFIGSAFIVLLPQYSQSFTNWEPVVYGAFLIFAVVVFRYGFGGAGKIAAGRLSRWVLGVDSDGVSGATDSYQALEVRDELFSKEESGAAALFGEVPTDGKLLVIDSVSKHFGGVKALRDVSFVAQPGQVTALIGPNGSGKTTMLNVICGYEVADDGQVKLGDAKLTGMSTSAIAKSRGVSRTFQTPIVPRGVSVLDVVASGRFHCNPYGSMVAMLRLPQYWRRRTEDRRAAIAALEWMGMARFAAAEAASLSLGSRRLVEVARAVCGRPGQLLLDEPAAGLNESEIEILERVIERVRSTGTTVVLIEHNFRFISRVSDVVHVLDMGSMIASGSAAEVAADPQVLNSYLGEARET